MIRLLAGLPSDHPPFRDEVTGWGLAAAVVLILALAGWLLARGRHRGHHHRRNDKDDSDD